MNLPDHIYFQIPAHWIPAITQKDMSIFSDPRYKKERKAFDTLNYIHITHGTITTVGQSPYFSTQHDARPYGIEPCDVVDLKVVYKD